MLVLWKTLIEGTYKGHSPIDTIKHVMSEIKTKVVCEVGLQTLKIHVVYLYEDILQELGQLGGFLQNGLRVHSLLRVGC